MNKNMIIDINEYIKRKKLDKIKNKNSYAKRDRYILEEEERRKTFNLFMKVLASMEKESYK
ncbi:hypothetical protein [Clostridium formicaceticum]|uniref:Uncharacterized protein n=1 Tax=Clostridium formicaceticum TaxID=1497 RepID=A0AAC9RI12_9CLOT|nr:hypothetical protein [Clostridium formicaceticum]AOY75443.1 hypothetical protein BJL90_05760 [Clostridium formicaceticum]ARE85728.1 hypothetical protein CLFO_00410 [Clostridium formicaceticum]